jgi:hypothetical protein
MHLSGGRAEIARLACATVACAILACAVGAAPPATAPAGSRAGATPAVAPPIGTAGLASLRRLLHHFDFEEAETVRVDFPRKFRRIIAEDRGFPRFGDVALTTDTAASGRWSFGLGLDGGSIAVGVPSGVLPILPLADYAVTTRVRTLGLTHARARLVAWFIDTTGRPIPESRVESPLLRTDGAWDTVSVHLVGDHPDAADLLFELQLLQPTQFLIGAEAGPSRDPVLEDVSGHAWFDDVSIWHLPRIELTLAGSDNVIVRPRRPELSALVRDLSNEPLAARMRVTDLAGHVVFEERFPAPRGRHPVTVTPPLDACGWYRAELAVESAGAMVARAEHAFVIVPAERRRTTMPANTLAVAVPFEPIERLERLPTLVRRLNVGGASVVVWDERMRPEDSAERFQATRRMIDALLASDTEVTFALDSVPARLARTVGVDTSQVLELLSRDPAEWRTHLDEMLINFGLRVRRWQVGSAERADAFWKPDLQELVDDVTASLSRFLPEPTLIIPFTAEQEISSGLTLRGISITVPHEIAASALAEYATPWIDGDRALAVTFGLLPTDVYGPRQQVVDTLLRGLHGWRADLPVMAIRAPWRWNANGAAVPDPAFAAWRGLTDALGGRHFAGELALGDTIQCWLMEGPSRDDDALVVWRDQAEESATTTARLILADHPVRVRDAFGNSRELAAVDGVHELPIGDLPIFVENIDLPLAQFRAGFEINPPFVPARHRAHEREIVLRNPWDVGISGTIRLLDPAGCHISPRRHEFVIRANEEVRLPVTVVCDRSVVSGEKELVADIQLSAERSYRLRAATSFHVGWRAVELHASWAVTRNAVTGERDLVITQIVTNRGDRAMNLDAFVHAPGTGQKRRIIAALQPGATITRAFPIRDGAARLSGRRIRYGVSERDGVAQLNRMLELPDLSGFEPVNRRDVAGAGE